MIREATPYDIAQLGRLGRPFIEEAIDRDFVSFDDEGFVNALHHLISIGILRVLVAKEGQNITGATALLIAPNIYNPREILGDIVFIDVLPEHQKRGIGGELLARAEAMAKDIGVKALTVSFKNKEIADKVITSHGFTMFEYKLIKKVGD